MDASNLDGFAKSITCEMAAGGKNGLNAGREFEDGACSFILQP